MNIIPLMDIKILLCQTSNRFRHLCRISILLLLLLLSGRAKTTVNIQQSRYWKCLCLYQCLLFIKEEFKSVLSCHFLPMSARFSVELVFVQDQILNSSLQVCLIICVIIASQLLHTLHHIHDTAEYFTTQVDDLQLTFWGHMRLIAAYCMVSLYNVI